MENFEVLEISKKVYNYLLELHEKNPSFKFKPRINHRLEEGYYFLGNNNYMCIAFHTGGCWVTKTPNIYLEISKNKCSIRLRAEINDQGKINLINKVKEELENKTNINFENYDNKNRISYVYHYPNEKELDYIKWLEDYVNVKKPIIDRVVESLQPNKIHNITDEEYERYIKKVNKYVNKSIKANVSSSVEKYTSKLLTFKNIVLSGAPGTGKTYLAKEIAKEIIGAKGDFGKQIGFVQFHPSYDYTDFVEGLRPSKDNAENNINFERADGIFKSFCKAAIEACERNDAECDNFDESWEKFSNYIDENDFYELKGEKGSIHQYRLSNSRNSLIRFNVENGNYSITRDYLYKAYKGAEIKYYKGYVNKILDTMKSDFGLLDYKSKLSDKTDLSKYVFIIDEINRGELSKIFGELFYSIELGYRGKRGKIKTQYQNLIQEGDAFDEGFYIPENVYIIGTMNDIDRSIESIDFAMRRRFVWIEVKPEDRCDEMWIDKETNKKYEWADEAKEKMNNLNCKISETEGLGSEYEIGPAYFLKLNDYEDEDRFEELWENHLEPLLNEYLRGYKNKKELIEEFYDIYMPENEDGKIEEENE